MKIAVHIARVLLGLMFVFFGLNGFLQFMPMGPMPPGLLGQFLTAFTQSHYAQVISAFQILGGLLLLANRYVPLGLTILGPVIVNILIFHILLAPSTIGPGILVTILWFVVFFYHRQYFSGLFVQKAA